MIDGLDKLILRFTNIEGREVNASLRISYFILQFTFSSDIRDLGQNGRDKLTFNVS